MPVSRWGGVHNPNDEFLPARAVADLRTIRHFTRSVRLYGATDGWEQLPLLAATYGIRVTLGAWLDSRHEHNEHEVTAAIALASRSSNATRLLIGNETQLREAIPLATLSAYLDRARRELDIPVSTAETGDYWLCHPELARHVDFIAIHVLPYWAEVPLDDAVQYVLDRYAAVRAAFPGMQVVIAETGWPSDGPHRGAAAPSIQNQARFFREFVAAAERLGIDYNLVEAFDQPWKAEGEGRAGQHWGLFDAYRRPKFSLAGPVIDRGWPWWWAASAALASALLLTLCRERLRLRGQLLATFVVHSAVACSLLMLREASDEYLSPLSLLCWLPFLAANALLTCMIVGEGIEIAEVVGDMPLRRRVLPWRGRLLARVPFVSIHVPCCNEPPALVIATLEGLARLEYPAFEVIVVDNNTPDPSLGRPIAARCAELGPRFRFYSLGIWPGFKAGALNFARTVTDKRAEIIGVVDADYLVDRSWLRAAVPYFTVCGMALVQAPQEHRDWEGSLFRRMASDEYSGFFRIGMVQRNERDAIIQHGTMTLVRKSTLEALGGWAEWCICEDAELGLRLLASGNKSLYLDHPLGRGLVPDSFEAYAKQRFRWAYGSMRILRRHTRELFGRKSGLSAAQRYQFAKGWLPWLCDGLHLACTLLLVTWSGTFVLAPGCAALPEPVFLYPVFGLFMGRWLGMLVTYRHRVRVGAKRTLLAMFAGSALTHTVGKAVFRGLFTSGHPFYRTPKLEDRAPLLRALTVVREELALGSLLLVGAGIIITRYGLGVSTAVLWSLGLCVQAVPYGASVFASIASSCAAGNATQKPNKAG